MKQKLKKIKMILFDVDGVLTDGSIIYTDKGTEIKAFNIQDGMGITLARKSGLLTGIITGRLSSMVSRRVEELKIDTVSQGSFNKLGPYLKVLKKYSLSDDEICYIGDDIVDMVILNRVGFSAAVANAREEVKAICDYITVASGGQGAVREVIDLILKRQGKFDVIINSIVNSKGNE
jgi:3-deoxy-D-manno-octulosonate 8-phosphate phosphatase (KDO 8-P phosphatase)